VLRQLSNQFDAALQLLHAEVEIAVREVETAFREVQGNYVSMCAAEADEEYLQRRWEMLPGDDRAASFLLADLLDAQDRLNSAEYSFAQSQVAYTLSLTLLNRATGTLLKHEQVHMMRGFESCPPSIHFARSVESGDPATIPALNSLHD